MELSLKQDLLNYLLNFASDERKNLFLTKIAERTRFLSVVLEDIFHPQNASAVLRTCDCIGIQDIHIIENNNPYTLNPDVVLGSNKWLTLKHYNTAHQNTGTCLQKLKEKGYDIVATALHEDAISITEFVPKKKTAIVFGTELTGISETVKKHANRFIKIPMYGFTESFNISVAAGISLFTLAEKIRSSKQWKIPEEEQIDILLNWAHQSIKRSKELEIQFLKDSSHTG